MFSEHPKSKFWSDKNILRPDEVKLNSHKKIWFDCDKCGHCFESSLLNINQGNAWCPYCCKPLKKLCDNNNCKMCFNNSFASHPKSVYWSNENSLTPREVFKGASRKTFIFNCVCNHKLRMVLTNITCGGHWCSYCSHQKLCDDNNCKMCFDNSFASVDRSKFLQDKTINPRTIFKSTNKKYKFECDTCNKVFETPLSDVTNGVWCSFCVNKTEKILYDKLIKKYDTLQRQYRVEWCKNMSSGRYLPFDFVIEERKIIVELDGKQHFEQIGKWQSPEKNREFDLYKMKCANEKGFSVIRILQKDVYHNKYDWLNELQCNIENITDECRVQNIYMCKKNEYKDFDVMS
jgi:very-short-patch-repair endonuclease